MKTENLHSPPISVCLAVLFSSWYKHIWRRSSSVRVRRGFAPPVDDFLMGGAGAEGETEVGMEGGRPFSWKGDWLASMLGQECGGMGSGSEA